MGLHLEIWNVTTGRLEVEVEVDGYGNSFTCLYVLKDGTLAIGTDEAQILLWDVTLSGGSDIETSSPSSCCFLISVGGARSEGAR
jgi:hypothetical protein